MSRSWATHCTGSSSRWRERRHPDCSSISRNCASKMRARGGAPRTRWQAGYAPPWTLLSSRALEHEVARYADEVWFVTEDDAASYRAASGVPTRVVPNTVPAAALGHYRSVRPVPGGYAYLGAFDHGANLQAATRLVKRIHPLVRRHEPSARLTLIGRRPPDDLRRLAETTPGVSLRGDVADAVGELAATGPLSLHLNGAVGPSSSFWRPPRPAFPSSLRPTASTGSISSQAKKSSSRAPTAISRRRSCAFGASRRWLNAFAIGPRIRVLRQIRPAGRGAGDPGRSQDRGSGHMIGPGHRLRLALWRVRNPGTQRRCPACGTAVARFAPYGVALRADAQCPGCGSTRTPPRLVVVSRALHGVLRPGAQGPIGRARTLARSRRAQTPSGLPFDRRRARTRDASDGPDRPRTPV